MDLPLYFSQYFNIDSDVLDQYGAFDISVVSDLPLFVDPFLLFNSENPTYQNLHEEILRYLRFLRDQAVRNLDAGSIDAWYRFKEVKQNWLGFTLFGNSGAGLGKEFAVALHSALGDMFRNFGRETVTRGSHLEKLCLIRPGVGKDNISDFTANLIKAFLCEYTQTFARKYLSQKDCEVFAVSRVRFNYETRTWVTERYYLPRLRNDFVLLTPTDLLTRDDTWINYSDMVSKFRLLPDAVPNVEQRSRVNQYFARMLGDEDRTAKKQREAVAATISMFPELVDLYIKLQEDNGTRAEADSARKVKEAYQALVLQLQQALVELTSKTEFYEKPWSSYRECLERVQYFKAYIENNDGYRLFNRNGKPFSNEKDLQLAFGLVWCGSEFDINREVNNGRGPVDFKASYGAGDKSLIEFKLASNTALKRNLQKQVQIYEAANRTRTSVKVIVIYNAKQERGVKKILHELGLEREESIVLIDARSDNKPAASTA
ncbi:hypothetical protein ACIBI7_52320 [Nonomuraea fuscirosea]|uniref:hypothetical protein n=1 Tax=Nonomuraea fuscirosea TaxID=1291556 RepID=UPI0037A85CE5